MLAAPLLAVAAKVRGASANLDFGTTGRGRMTMRQTGKTLTRLLMLLSFVLSLGASDTALAHNDEGGRIPGMRDFERVGKTTYRYLPGREEYEVDRPGMGASFVHNDAPEADGLFEPAETAYEVGAGISLPEAELEPICRYSGNRIVVVYTHRSGAPDAEPGSEIAERLEEIVWRMNAKIADQAAISSAGKRVVRMAVDCQKGKFGTPELFIHSVTTNDNNFSTVFSQVPSKVYGFPGGTNSVKYLIFDDLPPEQAPFNPGVAEVRNDARKISLNFSARATLSALIYGTEVRWETEDAVHELVHTLGGSQGTAKPPPPFTNGQHHCTDGIDILCYDDGVTESSGYNETRCPESEGYGTPEGVPIDCGYDTYFNTLPEAGTWLAQYWDVGGPEDPFLLAPPSATTEAASELHATEAQLNGKVNPENSATKYHFEYGATTAYGSSVPVEPKELSLGIETISVAEKISGLTAGATYHYRLVAENEAGITTGEDRQFTTTPPPVVVTENATQISHTQALLRGKVNPRGTATTYQFEYGTSEAYGSKVPVSPKEAGAGSEDVSVSEGLEGLAPRTTYHYRLVATNAEGSTTLGGDMAFFTWGDWSLQTPSSPVAKELNSLEDVSCPSSTVCLAAGTDSYSGRGLGEYWNGEKWSLLEGEAARILLNSVSCGSTSACWAAGENLEGGAATVEKWTPGTGSAWKRAATNTLAAPAGGSSPKTYGISCTAATTCVAVGRYSQESKEKPLIERLEGTTWSIQTAATAEAQLKDVSCASASDCIAVGTRYEGAVEKPVAEHWNGEKWAATTLPSPSGATFARPEAVSCSSTSFCMATGVYSTEGKEKVFSARWNGTSWTVEGSYPTGSSFGDVVCTSSTSCVVVGQEGSKTVIQVWNGSGWSTQTSPNPEGKTPFLYGVSCSSAGACTTVGKAKNSGGTAPLAERYS